MYRSLILLLLLLGLGQMSQAQIYDDEVPDSTILGKKNKKDKELKEPKPFKLTNGLVGSGFGFSFWGNQIRLDLVPYVGYRIAERIAVGVGGTYIYAYDVPSQISQNIAGPKALIRLRPIRGVNTLENIYFAGEADYLTYRNSASTQKVSAPMINVGLGYTSNFEKGWGITTDFLFNVLYFQYPRLFNSPFQYRIGIYYGF